MKYTIEGASLPVLLLQLDQNESVECQRGAMSWMDEHIEMTTKFGRIGKVIKRLIAKEPLALNRYTASEAGEIAFATRLPGTILAIEITPDKPVIIQKGAFLAACGNLKRSVCFQKRLRVGLFGGEGFIMQKISGTGYLFIEIDGFAKEYELEPGQKKIVDMGHVVMMGNKCCMDIKPIKGIKNILFGGEGLFNTVVEGPGNIILQSMPIQKTVITLRKYMGAYNKQQSKINTSDGYSQ